MCQMSITLMGLLHFQYSDCAYLFLYMDVFLALYHLKMLQCFLDCLFLLRRAFGLAAVLGLGLVVVLTLLDAAFLLDLCDIEVTYIQARMFFDITPNLFIGSFGFSGGHIQFIHLQVNRDFLVDI